MTTTPALDAEVVQAMAALRDHRRTADGVMDTKRRVLARLVLEAGVSKRRVHEHVCALLEGAGWSPEDIAVVGVSAPQVRADLARVLH